jgi:hypothetical protein
MKSNKAKILVFIIFLVLVVGGGFLLSMKIRKNAIQKTGFRTNHNPNYIDSMVRAKKK